MHDATASTSPTGEVGEVHAGQVEAEVGSPLSEARRCVAQRYVLAVQPQDSASEQDVALCGTRSDEHLPQAVDPLAQLDQDLPVNESRQGLVVDAASDRFAAQESSVGVGCVSHKGSMHVDRVAASHPGQTSLRIGLWRGAATRRL